MKKTIIIIIIFLIIFQIKIFPDDTFEELNTAISLKEAFKVNKLIKKIIKENKMDLYIEKYGYPLSDAIYSGSFSTVNVILKNMSDITDMNGYLRTAINYGYFSESSKIIDAIIKKGADVNEKIYGEYTPIEYAIYMSIKKKEVYKILIDNGADIKKAFFMAVRQEYSDIINILIECGLDPIKTKISTENDGEISVFHYLLKGWFSEPSYQIIDRMSDKDLKEDDKALIYILYSENIYSGYMIDVIKKVIKKGVNINKKYLDNITPLQNAVKFNKIEVVKILLDAGADIKIKDETGDNIIFYALKAHVINPEVIELLIKYGADFKSKNSNGITPLHYAFNQGRREAVRVFLNNGVDVSDINYMDIHGYSILHKLITYRNVYDLVELIIKKGADVNSKNKNGNSILIDAAKGNNDPKIISLLIEHGADVNAKDNKGKNSLYHALNGGKKDFVEILMNAGAEIEIFDKLYFALHTGHYKEGERIKEIEKIIKEIDDLSIKDKHGQTVLHHISGDNMLLLDEENKLINYLVKSGADIDSQDNWGRTAIFYRTFNKKNYIKSLEPFIKWKADLNIKDKYGYTLLDEYIMGWDSIDKEVINYLRQKGARFNSNLSYFIYDLRTKNISNIKKYIINPVEFNPEKSIVKWKVLKNNDSYKLSIKEVQELLNYKLMDCRGSCSIHVEELKSKNNFVIEFYTENIPDDDMCEINIFFYLVIKDNKPVLKRIEYYNHIVTGA